jgi:hypothetical protein
VEVVVVDTGVAVAAVTVEFLPKAIRKAVVTKDLKQ